MVYNLTALGQNSTNAVGFIQTVNTQLMFGWLGILILLSITVIALLAFMRLGEDTNRAVAASAFIAFGLSIFLKMMNLIPNIALFITLVGSAAAIAFIWKR